MDNPTEAFYSNATNVAVIVSLIKQGDLHCNCVADVGSTNVCLILRSSIISAKISWVVMLK